LDARLSTRSAKGEQFARRAHRSSPTYQTRDHREPSNIKHRQWRRTLPVLHLAYAVTLEAQRYEQEYPGENWHISHLFGDEVALIRVLVQARFFEAFVERLREFDSPEQGIFFADQGMILSHLGK
jgi:hypothetical protein